MSHFYRCVGWYIVDYFRIFDDFVFTLSETQKKKERQKRICGKRCQSSASQKNLYRRHSVLRGK